MALTSGFYNAKYSNGVYDRAYDANDMSIIASMLVYDGIFVADSDHFQVTPGTGLVVNIAPGRAWFRSKWIYNSESVTLSLPNNPSLSPRWDAVIIDLNLDETSDSGRMATFSIVSSPESSSPVMPVHSTQYPEGGTYTVDNRQVTYLAYNGSTHFQYPLAYIYRTVTQSSITTSDITSVVGLSSYKVPGVAGIVDDGSKIEELYTNWENDWLEWMEAIDSEYSQWISGKQEDFDTWFESVQETISGDEEAIIALTGRVSTAEIDISHIESKIGSRSDDIIVLGANNYGTDLPSTNVVSGRLFFKKISG